MPDSNPTLDAFDMTGRRAIVTGACGLLGREFCYALTDLGAHVVAIDADEARLAELVPTTGRGTIQPTVCDVTDRERVAATVDAIAADGSIDALITSAAVDPKVGGTGEVSGGATDFVDYPQTAWDLSLAVNVTGMFLVAQAVAAVMTGQDDGNGRGAIVTIASTYGLTGPDQRLYLGSDGAQQSFKPIDYPTTKAAVLGFTRALAAHYRETGIRVNALTPGGAFNGQDPAFVDRYASRTILGRMANPGEYRSAIAFLCSDASSYMTGANLVVDGGWTAL